MCTKTIKYKDWFYNHSWPCNKPEFKEGLCKKHYTQNVNKTISWGDRNNYRSATLEDFNKRRSLKLKSSSTNNLFKYINGVIKQYSNKEGKYIECIIPVDVNLFCVKEI